MMMFRFAAAFVVTAALALPALAPAWAEDLGANGDWAAVKEIEGGKPVCYMSSKPQKDEGDYKARGDIFLTITHRPAEKALGVVSIQAGYTYKSGAPVTVTVDKAKTFQLFSQDGYAWAREATDDQAIVKAMQGGNSLVVQGTSSKGTATTDTYSLTGFSASYKAISTACGVK